jgi:hypothetical protein
MGPFSNSKQWILIAGLLIGTNSATILLTSHAYSTRLRAAKTRVTGFSRGLQVGEKTTVLEPLAKRYKLGFNWNPDSSEPDTKHQPTLSGIFVVYDGTPFDSWSCTVSLKNGQILSVSEIVFSD